ncbi:MAG: CHASE2 domain-containing protein [Phycisphaerales bacterium]|nr:CHASE2 domain-containing protein [Phycisphaerales bacterium]
MPDPRSQRATTRNRAAVMARVQWGIGLSVALLFVLLHGTRLTERLEYPFLDLNAKLWGVFSPGPSPDVVVVAIDDASLRTHGRWPWPRERIGRLVDELGRASPAVIALDVLMDDPQAPRIEGDLGAPASLRVVDGDGELAAAVRRAGNVISGASFRFRAAPAAVGAGDVAARVPFSEVLDRVRQEPDIGTLQIRDRFRGTLGPVANMAGGPSLDDLEIKRRWAGTLVRRGAELALRPPSAAALNPPAADEPSLPAPPILDASAAIASVSFGSGDPDGTVRRVPLFVRLGPDLFPSLGVAGALRKLGVPIADVRVEPGAVIIPTPGGVPLRLQTHAAALAGFPTFGVMQFITWPRGGWGGWQAQLAPAGQDRGGEISAGALLDVDDALARVASNFRSLESGMRAAGAKYGLIDDATAADRARLATGFAPDSTEFARAYTDLKPAWSKAAEAAGEILGTYPAEGERSAEENESFAELSAVARQAPKAMIEIERGLRDAAQRRDMLRARLAGKVVFVGWTATAAVADFVPTSIDPRTPGVHVHAAVASSILGGHRLEFGTRRLLLMDLAAVFLLGLAGAWVGVRFPVLVGPAAIVGGAASWMVLSGLGARDAAGLVLATGTPIFAGALAWLGVILHRLLVEQRSRRRTEARFRAYVSPDVVDILVNNPDMDSMAPADRELTVFFSDIAGFSTLSERLGTEETGRLLNTYLAAMTGVLQKHRATLDKYLGDGIMAFWGAPVSDLEHALHAAEAALEMFRELAELNTRGAFGEAGSLGMRIGMASGVVSVGDFGNPPRNSAYTVLGDVVNLASRCESAGKQLGAECVINSRTRELLGPRFAVRPIGRIVVKGRRHDEMLFELLGDRRPFGEQTPAWIAAHERLVAAAATGDLAATEAALADLTARFGPSPLARLYRHAMDLARGSPEQPWTGTLVLEEK